MATSRSKTQMARDLAMGGLPDGKCLASSGTLFSPLDSHAHWLEVLGFERFDRK